MSRRLTRSTDPSLAASFKAYLGPLNDAEVKSVRTLAHLTPAELERLHEETFSAKRGFAGIKKNAMLAKVLRALGGNMFNLISSHTFARTYVRTPHAIVITTAVVTISHQVLYEA